jgi:hypothetical protein
MKLSTLIEQSELSELQGISFEARIWNKIIRNHIKIGKNSPVIRINGREYPKEYKVFPVDEFNIVVSSQYGSGAAYDENKSGYDNDKKYVVYLLMGPFANDSSINHELKHAYEDFMRQSKGATRLSNTKEGKMLFSGDFEKIVLDRPERQYGPFFALLMGLYYTSKIERAAYAETVYDIPADTPEIQYHNSTIIDYIVSVLRINDYSYIKTNFDDPEELNNMWNELKKKYKIPIFEKFNDPESFIKWATDEIKYKGEKTLKKLRNVKYLKKQKGTE